MTADLYGVTTNSFDLEEAAVATLRAWLPAHCHHQERANSLASGALPVPQEFPTASELDLQAHQRLPAVYVVSPGGAGAPEKLTDGTYRVTYRLEVAVVTADNTERNARRFAAYYLAAIRGALIQQPTLGGVVEDTLWVGPDDLQAATLPGTGKNQRAIFGTAFAITARGFVDRYAGPSEVPFDPSDGSAPSPALTALVVATSTEPRGTHQ